MDSFYSNSKKSWYPDEDATMIRLYKHCHYDLVQLANLHKRTPGKIVRRLKLLKIVKTSEDVNGYLDYKNSDLYYIINNKERSEGTAQIEEPTIEEATIEENESQSLDEESQYNTTITGEDFDNASIIDNTLEQYPNSNEPWSETEYEELIKYYKIDNLSLMDLADKHARHPDLVVHKLRELHIIKTLKSCKGYNLYKQSDLYRIYKKLHRRKRTKSTV